MVTAATHAERVAARVETDRVEVDGFVRKRYRGRPRKGSPSIAQQDLLDARIALGSLQRAVENLEHANNEGLIQSQRDDHRIALGQLSLVWRAVEKVLDRKHDALFRRRRSAL